MALYLTLKMIEHWLPVQKEPKFDRLNIKCNFKFEKVVGL